MSEFTNDPVYKITDKSPLKASYSNFVARELYVRDADTLVFRPRITWLVLRLSAFVLIVFALTATMAYFNNISFWDLYKVLYLLILPIAGGFAYKKLVAPIMINLRARTYSTLGSKTPPISLNNMYAVQLLTKQNTTSGNRMFNHELNFVMNDGSRFNVACHNNEEKIQEEAEGLAEMLKVELWNEL